MAWPRLTPARSDATRSGATLPHAPGPVARLPLALCIVAMFTVALPAAPAHALAQTGSPQTGLKIIPLTIKTSDGRHHVYKVELAATPEQQAHGMMFRTAMLPRTGMIFPMTPPRPASFWMRNTLIPLDLIFIGANGRVRNIIAGAVPKSEAPLSSVGAVAAVLELDSGEARRIGLKPGDAVIW